MFVHFGTLCIKSLNIFISHTDQVRFNNYLRKYIFFNNRGQINDTISENIPKACSHKYALYLLQDTSTQ